MAFGADSDARTRTYRLYVRQTKSGSWHRTIHTIEATADNYVQRWKSYKTELKADRS